MAQAVEQLPQCAGLVSVNTHLPPQLVPHEHLQAPDAQVLPQAPQFSSSDLVSTHVPPQ